jgi:tRNA (guanine37-N1)-methyltransferase
MINFTIVTIFPQMFDSPLAYSIPRRAREKNLISVKLVDPRVYATDRHRTTDDSPYGGGPGMVMKVEPLVAAIEDIRTAAANARVLLLSPRGRMLNQKIAERLAQEKEIVLVCGRYEGIDERVKAFVDDELSVGDYMLSGGEPAALIVIDAVSRLIPGVLGNQASADDDSFAEGLLEYPQYTRPEDFRGMRVPEILLSGDHEKIRRWRREQSLILTRQRRPDLLVSASLAASEQQPTRSPRGQVFLALLHYPVYDKNRQVVTTAVTNMDIHDIARSARTYGIKGFYVVTPVKALQKLALKILEHWETGYGSQYNATRKEALSVARIRDTLDDAVIDIERRTGMKPVIVGTSARRGHGRTSFATLKEMIIKEACPFLILLGTGWGLTESIFAQADYVLAPIEGTADYNHLSVRSAAAIMLDRLLAPEDR